MNQFTFFLFLLLHLSIALSYDDVCKEGSWKEIDPLIDPLPSQYARNRYIGKDKSSEIEFLHTACKAQVLFYSCYYQEGHPEYPFPQGRAKRLEYSRFHPENPLCLAPRTSDMLSILQNRRILLLGDSVMIQIYLDLLCKLSSSVDIDIDITFGVNTHRPTLQCPFGKKHCHPYSGLARIRSFNIELYGQQMGYEEGFIKSKFINFINGFNMTKKDIVVFNYGLHCNNQIQYKSILTEFMNELLEYQQSDTMPTIFLLESTPQHFPTSNGYFDPDVAKESQFCGLPNVTSKDFESPDFTKWFRSLDYRNILLQSLYNSSFNNKGFGPNINLSENHANPVLLIPIAEALYSRIDAHIDRSPFFWTNSPDCTHWCMPNGIFAYIHQKLYNAWLDTFHEREKRNKSFRYYPNNYLVKGTGKSIFLIIDNKKYDFFSYDSFTSRGFELKDVHQISDFDLNGIEYAGSLN